ncbi:MAG TPA: hypothetical protein VFD62_00865 [Pyrinomonadaceae bacterium]|nr:hypothetical protein [Pyrinomonadaceae bacterium]
MIGLVGVFGYAQRENIFSDWRPNSNTHGVGYVGSKSCLQCHKAQAPQLNTPMGQALEVAPDCRIITARGKLTFKNGPYSYELARQGTSVVYTVAGWLRGLSQSSREARERRGLLRSEMSRLPSDETN